MYLAMPLTDKEAPDIISGDINGWISVIVIYECASILSDLFVTVYSLIMGPF